MNKLRENFKETNPRLYKSETVELGFKPKQFGLKSQASKTDNSLSAYWISQLSSAKYPC